MPVLIVGFWLPVGIGIAAWPWSGTTWVVIVGLLLAAWPVWELVRWVRKRRGRA